MKMENQLEKRIKKIGWQAGDPSFWDYFNKEQPEIAIVAPPLDTVPSKTGNAIYVLVEKIAQNIAKPIVVLSRGPVKHNYSISSVSYKILYYQGKTITPFVGRILPYKMRKQIWGSSIANVNMYFHSASQVCTQLKMNVAILEDVTQGVLQFNKQSSLLHLILHQHNIGPLGLTEQKWKQTLERLDEIVFVSHNAENQVENKFGPITIKTNVIYNGVDLSWFDPNRWGSEVSKIRSEFNIPPNHRVLLYVGRLLPQKGVLEAMKAFSLANIPDLSFVIVGDTSRSNLTSDLNYVAKLKTEVANMENQVLLVGNVSQEEIPAWYQMADVLVVPSIGEEGLPKVITEALAMGIPVIATDRGGNRELIRSEENGWLLLDAKNIEDFSKLLTKVFSDEDQLRKKKQTILAIDRCKMDQQRMVLGFTEIINRIATYGR